MLEINDFQRNEIGLCLNMIPNNYIFRITIVIFEIIFVYLFSGEFQPFFYQAF
jgi:hypothetical protein